MSYAEPPPAGYDGLLFSVPRTGTLVDVYVEKARSVAGCMICKNAIPRGVWRLSFVVRLVEPRVDKSGRQRRTERYNVHEGCVSDALRGREFRNDWSCWDCGKPPPGARGWTMRCFTTSRFAFGRLCDNCTARARWRVCDECIVFFPRWMVTPVVSWDGSAEVPVEEGDMLCEYCAEELGAVTVAMAKESERKFEALRQQMLEKGVFPR